MFTEKKSIRKFFIDPLLQISNISVDIEISKLWNVIFYKLISMFKKSLNQSNISARFFKVF